MSENEIDFASMDDLLDMVRKHHKPRTCFIPDCEDGEYCEGCDPAAAMEGCAENPYPCEVLELARFINLLRVRLREVNELAARRQSKLLRVAGLADAIEARVGYSDQMVSDIAQLIQRIVRTDMTADSERAQALVWGVFDG